MVVEPVIDRYCGRGVELYFRAEAAWPKHPVAFSGRNPPRHASDHLRRLRSAPDQGKLGHGHAALGKSRRKQGCHARLLSSPSRIPGLLVKDAWLRLEYRMQSRRVVLYACSLVLVGCVGADQHPLTGSSVVPAQTRRGAAAYLFEQCPVNPSTPAEAIPALAVGALAPLLASFAVNVGQKLLESMEEGLTGQFTAGTASVNLYKDGGALSFGCIVIARGLFGAPAPSVDSGDGKLTPTHLSKLSLAEYPAFYMEAEATLHGESLLLQPRYIRYAQSSARREGSGIKHVGVVVALADASLKPNEDPTDEKSIALYRFDLGRLEIGRSYEHSQAAPLLAGTASQQSISADTPGRIPFNLLAIVTESEEPGLVLEALSSAYGSKKGDLEKAITDIIKGAILTDEAQS